MIRHLRWKVVATNMLLISLVLLAVFAAVYFISRGNYHKNVQQQLYQALEQGDYGRSQPGMDSIPCFVAEVYGSGTVRVAGNSYYDLSDETRMAEIVTARPGGRTRTPARWTSFICATCASRVTPLLPLRLPIPIWNTPPCTHC